MCRGIRKVGSTAVKLLGQTPNGELGFCDFVVEFGVSVFKRDKTKQLSRAYQLLAMTHVLAAAAGPTQRPPMQKSNPARRRQEQQLQTKPRATHVFLKKLKFVSLC